MWIWIVLWSRGGYLVCIFVWPCCRRTRYAFLERWVTSSVGNEITGNAKYFSVTEEEKTCCSVIATVYQLACFDGTFFWLSFICWCVLTVRALDSFVCCCILSARAPDFFYLVCFDGTCQWLSLFCGCVLTVRAPDCRLFAGVFWR